MKNKTCGVRFNWLSRISLSLIGCLVGLLGHVTPAFADLKLNMLPGVTPLSKDIYDLHMVILLICVFIGVVVFGVMFYSIIKHRKSKGAIPAQFHENTVVEMTWAIIPLIILVIMAIPATIVIRDMHDTADSEVTIKITGYQWKWKYEYLDQGISYFSNLSTPYSEIHNEKPKNKWYLLEVDKPMVVPVGEKIRFLITSNDVIHSWWVPTLGVKKDAVPGFIHEAWAKVDKPGTYRGQCTELCGANHGFMPIVVIAKSKAEFAQWVAQQHGDKAKQVVASDKSYSKDELMKMGKAAYDKHCAVCHKVDGSGMPPAFPALKNSPVATGPIAKHIDVVVKGVSGTAMQAFGSQLSDKDLAAIITYERNAWGNNKGNGGMVQPSDVKAAKGQ